MKVKYNLLFLCALMVFPAVLRAQEPSGWSIKGFVDTYHAVRAHQDADFMSSRTRVRGELGKTFGKSSVFVSLNAAYNAILKNRTGFELREAYLDHSENHWGVRLGRQLVIWGAADGLRITDLVSPMDMTEFLAQDYDDIRMPVNAVRLFVYNEFVRAEAIAVPVFQGYILPVEADNPWCVLPKDLPLPVLWKPEKRDFRLADAEYGGRVAFTLPSIDFSVSGLYTWNKMPVIQYVPSLTEISIVPQYYRMGFVGADVSKPLGQLVLRGEAAYNIDKHFSYKPEAAMQPQQGFNSINWLVGIDWYAPADWMLSVQFSSENIFGYQDYVSQGQNNMLATFHVSKKLFNSTFQLSDFTYFDVANKGWFSRFSADYALSDQIHLMGGYDWFGGDKGVFATYKNNSEFWVRAKYCF